MNDRLHAAGSSTRTAIRLAQYAGRTLVLTFVYTRCPVPEFCPLTLKHFRELDEALARDPALAARAYLLTISFDTAYDTPAVLRSFGRAHVIDRGGGAFARWEFATGSSEQIRRAAATAEVSKTGPGS